MQLYQHVTHKLASILGLSLGNGLPTTKKIIAFAINILIFSLSVITNGHSAPLQPDDIPGWNEGSSNGVVLAGNDVQYSSTAVGDLDNNPSNGLETAVASSNGTLHVVSPSGEVLWSRVLPSSACTESRANNKLYSSPTIGDLYGNGSKAIVIGYGGLGGRNCDGGVSAFRANDGKLLWNFSLKKFGKKEKFGAQSRGVFSTPALADTDGDGKLEVGFGSFDRNVYLLNYNGTVRWYYNAADTVWSSATFYNVDQDPDLEMIIGTDISKNTKINPPTHNGGYLYAFKTKARKKKKILFRDSSAFVWKTDFDQVLYSSPVVADVLSSNPGPEVIIGSGCYFPTNTNDKLGKWISIVNPKNGRILQQLRTTGCLSSTVAVGDIDKDGKLEVVATVNGSKSIGGDGKSRISAWKAENPEPFWSTIPNELGQHDSFGGHFQSPAIADLNQDGALEVVAANGFAIGIYDGATGIPLTCQSSSCVNGFTLRAKKVIKSTPSIADINQDGVLDLVVGAGDSSKRRGVLLSWSYFSTLLGEGDTTPIDQAVPWAGYRGGGDRSGRYSDN